MNRDASGRFTSPSAKSRPSPPRHDHDPLGPRLAESFGVLLSEGPKLLLYAACWLGLWALILSIIIKDFL